MQPVDVVIVGNALNSFGLVGSDFSVQGLGLNTFGFLWPCDGIWNCGENSITTTWVGISLAINNTEVCVA